MIRNSRCGMLVATAWALLLGWPAGASAGAGDASRGYLINGALEMVAKYDSNAELTRRSKVDDLGNDYVHSPEVQLTLNHSLGRNGWLAAELSGLANWYVEHHRRNWYFGTGKFALDYNLGRAELDFSNTFSSYVVPRQDRVSFLRDTAILTYKRPLTPRWQLKLGYENVATFYSENAHFNYAANGVFAELHQTWTPAFSTYYSYDFQLYRGGYNADLGDQESSPNEGHRHTLKLGFDWGFARNLLSGSYFFQVDDSSGQGRSQIGDFEGNEESLDVDAEFNFAKHKETLFYERRLTERISWSSYQELISKDLGRRDNPRTGRLNRRDTLLLASTFLKFRLWSSWFLETRYLMRLRHSTIATEDYEDHMAFLGLGYRF